MERITRKKLNDRAERLNKIYLKDVEVVVNGRNNAIALDLHKTGETGSLKVLDSGLTIREAFEYIITMEKAIDIYENDSRNYYQILDNGTVITSIFTDKQTLFDYLVNNYHDFIIVPEIGALDLCFLHFNAYLDSKLYPENVALEIQGGIRVIKLQIQKY